MLEEIENKLQATTDTTTFELLLTDAGNSRILGRLYGDDIRYCYDLNRWFVWDGQRWVADKTGEIYRKAKTTTDRLWRFAKGISDDDKRTAWMKHTVRSQAANRIEAMVRLARSEIEIAVNPEKLDVDPWLLNVQNGTLDLKRGELRSHKRQDLITKIAPVIYDDNAKCSSWEKFLHEIMAGDHDLVRFLQKAIGYSLTGDTREQVFFILYGTGANGKSTLVNTILHLLGDYALQTPTETLLAKKHGNGISNDVARLKGARFVAAVEAEHGRHLAEALVKQLTGGDKMTARHLYAEFFEFEPAFKLFLSVNHLPVIKSADHGIWRRIRLIPFSVTIPPGKRDADLINKFKIELPGILRWAVEGCMLWQNEGLEPPDAMKTATDNYRSEMDIVGEFIAECCEIDDGAKTPFKDLFKKYDDWSMKNDDFSADKNEFARALGEWGFPSWRSSTGRYRRGIRLK
jgi:putative DNA primase/helicase